MHGAHTVHFDKSDIEATLSFDCTGALPVSLGDGREWAVTLCFGVKHAPELAVWGVALWDKLNEPVGCFIAPLCSTQAQLTEKACSVVVER